jgi:hypothetical protein
MDEYDLLLNTLDLTPEQLDDYVSLKLLIDNAMGHHIVGMPVKFDEPTKAKLLELAEKLPGGKFALYLSMEARLSVDHVSQIQSPLGN